LLLTATPVSQLSDQNSEESTRLTGRVVRGPLCSPEKRIEIVRQSTNDWRATQYKLIWNRRTIGNFFVRHNPKPSHDIEPSVFHRGLAVWQHVTEDTVDDPTIFKRAANCDGLARHSFLNKNE